MTQVNLLPSTIRQRQRSRQVTLLAAAGVAAVLAVLIGVFFLESARLSNEQNQLASVQAQNAQLQQQIAALQPYADLKAKATASQKVVDSLTTYVVHWSSILSDMSSMMPNDVFIRAVGGNLNASTGGATSSPNANGLMGSMQIQGTATSQPAVAAYLDRVSEVNGWVNAWVTTSTLQTDGTVQFTGTIDLSQAVTTKGGK